MLKKILLALVVCAVLLCACTTTKSDDGKKENQKNDVENISLSNKEDTGVDVSGIEDPSLKGLLDGSISFIDAETGKEATIFTLPEINDFFQGMMSRYCSVDLNNDGVLEYMFEDNYSGNTAVLHKEDEIWRAYMMVFRARLNVKIDGEMSWSGGASYNGTARLEFADGAMNQVILLNSDSDKDVHTMLGEEISSEEAMRVWRKFDKKKNADWFDIYPAFEIIEY